MRRKRHQKAAPDHRAERKNNRAGVTELLQHYGSRKRNHAISKEECELGQHRFRVGQAEHGAHAGHQRIDGSRHEAPCEEERGDIGKGRIETRSLGHSAII